MFALVFLLVCAVGLDGRSVHDVRCARARANSDEALVVDKDTDKTAPPLTEDELDAGEQINEEELEDCFGVKPSGLDDPDMLEGDIQTLGAKGKNATAGQGLDGLALSALKLTSRLWPGGRIPYVLSAAYTDRGRNAIGAAVKQLQTLTCLRLVQKTAQDRDYIKIFPDDGCYSYVGRRGGEQPVSLDTGCLSAGIIIHEIMHAAGFIHEHSRPDRDKYISVLYENIRPGLEGQFERYPERRIAELEVGYDYASLMHYRSRAFSRNGQPTIRGLRPGSQVMGSRDEMSRKDVRKVRALYACDASATTTTSTTGRPATDPASCGTMTRTACRIRWVTRFCPRTCA